MRGTLTLALCVLLCMCLSTNVYSQVEGRIQYIPAQTEQEVIDLVIDTFIANDCFEVLNITIGGEFGNNPSLGYFHEGMTAMGMESGLVITNGPLQEFQFGNSSTGAGGNLGIPGDQNLTLIEKFYGGSVGNTVDVATYDAGFVEFDFIPTAEEVNFTYVFASEEYCDYVASVFNDKFGIFLSGPGITAAMAPFQIQGQPAINIAEFDDPITGARENVSINNINNVINPQLYIDNNIASTIGGGSCGPIDVSNNPFTQMSQFDGWTVPLEASYDKLEICETYRVRIVVADGSDEIFGSAVYLQSSSFNAAQGAGVTDITFGDTGETYTYESCGDSVALVEFTRQQIEGTDNFADIDMPIEISGSATYGLDFCTDLDIFGSVVLGPFGAFHEIIVKGDDEQEGSEFINILIQNPCFCDPEEYELEIIDVPPIEVRPLVSDTACFNNTRDLIAIVDGGGFPSVDRDTPPATFDFTWSDDSGVISTDATHTVDISDAGSYTYYLEVGDGCGGTHRDTVNFVTSGIPDADLDGVYSICAESPTAILNLTLEGEGPWTLGYNIDGIAQTPIVILDADFEFIADQIGEYEITRIDGANCGRDVEGLAVVSNQSYLLDIVPTQTLCNDSEDGVLTALISAGTGAYTYEWSDEDSQNTEMAIGLAPGDYTVTVTDELGCTSELTATVPAAPAVSVEPSLVSGTTCADLSSGEVSAVGAGGTGVYTYEWLDNGAGQVGTGESVDGLAAGSYQVIATDENGCESSATVMIPSDENTPDAVAVAPNIDCNNMTVTVDASGTSTGTEFAYSWTISNGGSISSGGDSPNAVIDQPGSYILTVTNTTNGCTATAPLTIEDNTLDPVADAGASFDCIDSAVQLGGADMEIGTNISYAWSSIDGGTIQGAVDVANPMVSEAGTYEVLVTNTATGCTAISQVAVSVAPVAAIADPEAIDCLGNQTVTLSGSSNQSTDISYAWTASNGGVIASDADTANPSVSEAGTYILTITNTATGCTNITEIPVEDIRTNLVADPGQAVQIDCNNTSVALGGTNTSTGASLSYTWQINPTVGPASTESSATITATQGGTYTLLVTDSNNGCTAEEMITVIEDTENPTVEVAAPALLTCEEDTQELMSTNSSSGAQFVYTWTTVGGSIISSDSSPNVTIDDPGSYTLTIFNTNNGCEEFATVDVLEDAVFPVATIVAPQNIDCDLTQVLLDGSGSDSGAGIEYTWTNLTTNQEVGSTASIMVDAAGEYLLEVNNTITGCTESDRQDVLDITAQPVADAGVIQTLNCETTTITLGGATTSTGAEFTYEWTLAGSAFTSSEVNPDITESGEYTLLVTNTSNKCTTETSIVIPQNVDPPVVTAAISGIITCQDPIQTLMSDGSSTGADFEYSWTGPDGFVSNLENPTVTIDGDYDLVITNTLNRCTETDQVTVIEDADFPEIAIEAPGIVSCKDMIIELSGEGSEEGTDIVYTWVASDGGVIEDDEDSLNPEISAAGTYTLTVNNTASGCSREMEVEVTDNFEDPTAMVNDDLTFGCQDETLEITGEGSSTGANFEYEWSAGQGNVSGPVDALNTEIDQPGNYILLVTNTENGCTAEAEFVVTPDEDLPTIVIVEPATITCDTEEVMIDASASDTGADLSYVWTKDGDTFTPTDNSSFLADEPGSYTLTITDNSNGCVAMGTTVVEETTDLPIAEAGDGIILNCQNMMLSLDGDGSSSGPEFSYAWSALNGGNIVSGEDTDEPLVDQPGTYLLTVTNMMTGCTETDEVPVLRNDIEPIVEIEEALTLNCRDEFLTLDASASDQGGVFEIEWEAMGTANIESGEETLTPMIDEPGTYVLTITNTDNFCESRMEITIIEDLEAPDVIIAEPGILTCTTMETLLDASGSSQGAGFEYEWSSLTASGSFASATNEMNAMANSPGTYELLVTNTANFCTSTFVISVDEDMDQPTAITGDEQVVTCDDPQTTLSGAGSSTGAEFEYSWAAVNSGLIVSGGNTLTPTVSSAGDYQLTVLNTENGCTMTEMQFVTSNEVFPQDAISEPVVLNCEITEQLISGSGNAGYTYSWTTDSDGSIVGDPANSEILINAPGVYTMTIIDNDNGCPNSIPVTVLEDIITPDVDAGLGSTLDCTATEVALSGEGSEGANFTYQWTTIDGAFTGDTDNLSALATAGGTYTLTIINEENKCVDTDNVNINVEEDVPTGIDAEAISPNCFGDPGSIDFVGIDGGVGPFNYSIDGGDSFTNQTLFTQLNPGQTYSLLIEDDNGCVLQQDLTIPTVDSLAVNVTEDFVEIELGENFDITAFVTIPEEEIVSITWSPSTGLSCDDCLNPVADPGNSINYNVVVVSENGCVDEANVEFRVDRNINIYVPNAFSPFNEDGVNDVFAPLGKPSLIATVLEFKIYDRWGEQVFEDGDFMLNAQDRGWKGEFREDGSQTGVFVYYFVLEFTDGSTELFEGNVTLMN